MDDAGIGIVAENPPYLILFDGYLIFRVYRGNRIKEWIYDGIRDNGIRDNGIRDNGIRDDGIRDDEYQIIILES